MVNNLPGRRPLPRKGSTCAIGNGLSSVPRLDDMHVIGMGGSTRNCNGSSSGLVGRPQGSNRGNNGSTVGTRSSSSDIDGHAEATNELPRAQAQRMPSAQLPVVQFFQACVKVYSACVAPCYALPWVRGEENHSTSSGFAVTLPSGHRRLIVQAHVVLNHTLVQVRRTQHALKYVAQVLPGHQADQTLATRSSAAAIPTVI